MEAIYCLSSQAKAYLLLVAAGIKPATECEFGYTPGGQIYTERDFLEDVNDVTTLIRKLGVPYEYQRKENEEIQYATFNVGKDRQHLVALLKATNPHDPIEPDEYQRALGLAFGFPSSAIEAFLQRKILSDRKSKLLVHRYPELRFLPFCPSAEHWREELEQTRRQINFIREAAPQLYADIVASPA